MSINLPPGAVASTTNLMGDLINSVFPFVSLAIGIPLAFYFIDKIKKVSPVETDKIKKDRETIERFNKKYGEDYKKWK